MRHILLVLLCLFSFLYAHEDNTNIDLILDVSYLNRNITDREYLITEVPDYIHSAQEDSGHTHAIRKNGFNLNYGEVAFLVPVEENVEMSGTFHLAEDTFEIEEFYGLFEYENLISKVGKFRSETGILNKQHDHDWYFYELPIVYFSFFSVHGLNEKGIQGRFENRFINVGGEILNGDNENSFGYGNASLYTVFIKPKYKSFSSGFSFIYGKDKLENSVNIYILEALYKSERIILQTEYVERNNYKQQYGFYIFGIFKPIKNLDIGYRYEYLKENLSRHSLVANLYKGKNIRLRFQYNIDKTRYIREEKKTINEFIVELTLSKSFKFE